MEDHVQSNSVNLPAAIQGICSNNIINGKVPVYGDSGSVYCDRVKFRHSNHIVYIKPKAQIGNVTLEIYNLGASNQEIAFRSYVNNRSHYLYLCTDKTYYKLLTISETSNGLILLGNNVLFKSLEIEAINPVGTLPAVRIRILNVSNDTYASPSSGNNQAININQRTTSITIRINIFNPEITQKTIIIARLEYVP